MLRNQLKNNAVALISLLVALSALTYNTWRNEETEFNRNIRFAGFEMLVHLGKLQRITFLSHYDRDKNIVTPRHGWVEIQVLQDLGNLMPEAISHHTERLFKAWRNNWEALGDSQKSAEFISAAIDELRSEVLSVLRTLD